MRRLLAEVWFNNTMIPLSSIKYERRDARTFILSALATHRLDSEILSGAALACRPRGVINSRPNTFVLFGLTNRSHEIPTIKARNNKDTEDTSNERHPRFFPQFSCLLLVVRPHERRLLFQNASIYPHVTPRIKPAQCNRVRRVALRAQRRSQFFRKFSLERKPCGKSRAFPSAGDY